MKIPLADTGLRWLFCISVLLGVAMFSEMAAKVCLAEHWADSSQPELWLRAARLEPGNAYYWMKLGRYKQWDFQRNDLREAIADYEKAAAVNPWNDESWLSLAEADEAVGDMPRARAAFEQAQADHPISAEAAWRYGNFLLRQGDLPGAFAEFRRALVTSPSLTANAVDECWKTTHSARTIVEEVLPQESDAYIAALNYFVNQNELDSALVVWKRLLANKLSVRLPQAIPLVNGLISTDRAEDADRVWQTALEATNWPRDAGGDSSLVFNGGLEHDLANGGFDWQEAPVAGALFDFDNAIAHSGSRSLRVTFDGSTNIDFQHVLQFVKVAPRRYRFAAFLRTEALSTDSGIRFEIFERGHRATGDLLTTSLEGTHPWTQVEAEITVVPDSELLAIVLRRLPSSKLDNKLRGTVWVDDVSLTPVDTAAVAADSR